MTPLEIAKTWMPEDIESSYISIPKELYLKTVSAIIQEERERCAKIAEELDPIDLNEDQAWGFVEAQEKIAKAIRETRNKNNSSPVESGECFRNSFRP